MATQVQLRRGSTSQHNVFTGAIGEITVDTDKDSLVIHDGSTQGGHPLAKSSDVPTGSLASLNSVAAGQIDANSVNASELNVTGNGTTSQYLRSDGDGTFTWTAPTNTTYTAGTGLDLTGTAFSVEPDLRDGITHVGRDANDYIAINTTSVDIYLDGTNDFRFENDGDFHADGDVIAYSTTISDDRLKTGITTVVNAVSKVEQLRGVEFIRTTNNEKSAGVIAQEVEKVLPQAVKEKALPLQTGDEETLYKTVEYDALHSLYIEAIKELSARVKELENK